MQYAAVRRVAQGSMIGQATARQQQGDTKCHKWGGCHKRQQHDSTATAGWCRGRCQNSASMARLDFGAVGVLVLETCAAVCPVAGSGLVIRV